MHTFTAMAGGSAVNYFNGQYLIYGLSVHWQDSSADLSGHTSLTYLFFRNLETFLSLFCFLAKFTPHLRLFGSSIHEK